VIGYKDSTEEVYSWQGDYLHKTQTEERLWLFRFSVLFYCYTARSVL